MEEMTGQVRDFAKEFGVLPDQVVPALYQSISAGVDDDNVFTFLEQAVKTSIGRFVAQEGLGLATSVNPLNNQSDTRSWRDVDGNGSILDVGGNVQFAELGPSRNSSRSSGPMCETTAISGRAIAQSSAI